MSEKMPDVYGVLFGESHNRALWGRRLFDSSEGAQREADEKQDPVLSVVSATVHQLVPAEQLDEALELLAALQECLEHFDPPTVQGEEARKRASALVRRLTTPTTDTEHTNAQHTTT